MKRIFGIALAAVLAAPAARSSGQSPQQQPPVFRAGTDVVQVDVVVHDKSGRFVPDLKPEDFEVSEEGKPQQIELFYVVGADETGTPAQAPPVTPAQPAQTPPVVVPHTPRLFVVVFDDDHLSPAGFKRVQAAAISLFEKDFKQGDVGGVVAGGRMVNNRLTTERKELLEAVRSAKPSTHARSRLIDEREWPRMTLTEAVQIRTNADRMVLEAVSLRACQDDPDACRRVDPTESIMEKAARMTVEANTETDATLRTLAVLMNGLGRFQGRKSVLLLTEGFMAEESWPIVGQAVGLAARANATIYTLDARGLDSHDMADHLTGSDPGALDAASRLLNQLDEGSDAMNSLAVDTGGFVVRNENIFDQAVARIADDASHYYVLGYRPDKAPDGKFRKISVKVDRPGVTLRARKGYVAAPRPAATTESARLEPGAPSDTPRAPSDTSTPSPTTPAPAEAPARPAPAAATAAPAAPATGTVVPKAADAGNAALHLRPDAARNVEELAANAPDADAERGWSAYQRGDLESARASLAAAAARPTARPWVHYALGQADYALGRYQNAVAEWETVRAGAPEFQPVYFDLVDGYIQLHDPDKAIGAMHAAQSRWPADAEVYEALGVVQTTRGALNDAIASFQKAVSLAPKDAVGYFNLAKALELRYVRTRRFVERTHTWMGNKSDLENAILNYRRYLEIGGPLEGSAREGLARLNWEPEK